MKSSAKNVKLASVDELFSTEEERRVEEVILRLPLSELHAYKGYPGLQGIMPRSQPYLVREDDPSMQELIESVKKRGIRTPGIVRPDAEGGYEIISGHRRHKACELAELTYMLVIVRAMNDEEAAIEIVDSNVQREDVLPSERAWAYRMRLEVEKRQGLRTDLTSSHDATKFRTDEEIGERLGISKDTLRRFISLTYLIPELLDIVDERKIGVTPASHLSVLKSEEQGWLLDAIECAQAVPSVAQAIRMKKASQEECLTVDMINSIICEEKGNSVSEVRLKVDTLHKYFPQSYTPRKMEEVIIKLLEQWQRKRQQQHER